MNDTAYPSVTTRTRDELWEILKYNNLTDMIVPGPLDDTRKTVLGLAYGIVVLIALPANLVLITVILSSPKMRTVTNLFLASLAVSDLLIATCNMPFSMYTHIHYFWELGDVLCKLADYVKGVTVISSILTLTAIAIDRYIAVCHPLSSRLISSTKQAIAVIVVLWFASCVLIAPQPFLVRVQLMGMIEGPNDNATLKTANMCMEYINKTMYPWAEEAYSYFFTCVLYVIPVIIISIMYGMVALRLWGRDPVGEVSEDSARYEAHTKKKKKVVFTLVLIVFCFVVCWFPYFIYHIVLLYYEFDRDLRVFFQLFGYLNCALNPIIYISLNDTFKTCAKELVHTMCSRYKKQCSCFDFSFATNNNGHSLATHVVSFRSFSRSRGSVDRITHTPQHNGHDRNVEEKLISPERKEED